VTYKKKLIEVALPLATINAEAAREKSIRHGHPSTLHLWWARRPLAAARAVLWASLVDDPSARPDLYPTEDDQQRERERLFDILERLVPWEASSDERVLEEARAEIVKSCDGELPQVLDPFGGGGAIPLESMRLGLPTYTGDLNPVAVLIQRAMLEIPARFANQPPVNPNARLSQNVWEGNRGLAADVQAYGEWMRDEAAKRIGQHYPNAVLPNGDEAIPIAWIWARTVKSPDPSWPGHVPLVRSWILAKKPGKPVVWVEPVVDDATKTIRYAIRKGALREAATVDRGSSTCVATGAVISREYIKKEARSGRMGEALIAIVADGPAGREFLEPTANHVEAARVSVPNDLPDGQLSTNTRHMVPPSYGLDRWAKLFTPRQSLALSTYSDLIAPVRALVEADGIRAGLTDDGVAARDGGTGAAARADAVVTYLGLGISRLADMCNALCRWESSRTQVRNLFGRQAVPMVWDFAENNVFNDAGGDYRTSLGSVVNALRRLPSRGTVSIVQRDARTRVAELGQVVVSTDPPYYDNVPYADLADFFYIWLRRSLAAVWPDECATLLTPKADEIVADPIRAGSKTLAEQHFERGMRDVFGGAAAHADPRYPASIFYAFKAVEGTESGATSTGWETFLSGLLDAGYSITATWPMRTELGNRMRATDSNALASSIVLACRPREITAPMATRGEFVAALRRELGPAVRLLQMENIAPVDLAQSAMGPGIAIYSRYARVVEADGASMRVRTALALINEALAEVLSGEESEFDADTRFALTWFEQFGHNPGPFGDADLLARAKDTTVAGVERAGIVASRDGKVRLVERKELSSVWDPATDSRLTVWETTQHLIRVLDSSETEAAALLARMGAGVGERARQLAYLLYGLCDRKKWADEAGAYNTLVTAWPEISRLAAAGPAPDAPGSLF
jgi:putative DNA methylase